MLPYTLSCHIISWATSDIDFYQIACPNFITWHWFIRNCGQMERLFKSHYPNRNPNIGLHPNPYPSRWERNIRSTGWSRDQNSFCLELLRGDFYPTSSGVKFGISKQKYVDLGSLAISELVNKKFWKIWASDLVKASNILWEAVELLICIMQS